tara:strand:- start:22 stop:570 length:549 start_codon:yes stop_codon:yes gene_type:complete
MIRLARPADDMQAGPLQQRKRYGGPPQAMQFQPGAMSQFGDAMKNRMLEEGMKKMAVKQGLKTAGAAAGGPMGMMAGEVAGELLPALLSSYFDDGGEVASLKEYLKELQARADYGEGWANDEIESTIIKIKDLEAKGFNQGGMAGMLGPLSLERINKVKYKRTGGKASEEIEIGLGPLAQGE